MATIVSLNGRIVGPEDATVSVFDRGFLYGDSVYEVLRTYEGVPFELEAHLERLAGSARRIGMVLPVSLDVIAAELKAAHAASNNDASYLRIVVTRGQGAIGLDPALARDQLRMIIAMELNLPPSTVYENGVPVVLTSVRRNLRQAIDPQAKTGNYLNSVMALAEAKKKGAFEAIMLDHRGFITEGASSNVFVLSGDVLLTPPVEAGILEGVTRRVVMHVARKAGLRLLELPLSEQSLDEVEEVFITSSIREIVPVVKVDDRIVGTGQPGPVVQQIRALFREYVNAYVKEHR